METPLQELTLRQARIVLGLSLSAAAALLGMTKNTLDRYERRQGSGSARVLDGKRRACRKYMALAAKQGYDTALFHESRLCPGEFPAATQERAA